MKKTLIIALLLVIVVALPSSAQEGEARLVVTNTTDRPLLVTATPTHPPAPGRKHVVAPNETWDTGFVSTIETRHEIDASDAAGRTMLACGVVMNSREIFVHLTDDGAYWFTCLPARLGAKTGCGLLECRGQRERTAKE